MKKKVSESVLPVSHICPSFYNSSVWDVPLLWIVFQKCISSSWIAHYMIYILFRSFSWLAPLLQHMNMIGHVHFFIKKYSPNKWRRNFVRYPSVTNLINMHPLIHSASSTPYFCLYPYLSIYNMSLYDMYHVLSICKLSHLLIDFFM